jgi:hypothetical protein
VKEDMMGKSLKGRGFILLEEEAFWEEDIYFYRGFFYGDLWCEEFGLLGVLGESKAGGTGLLGVLGTGARIPFGFLELGSRTSCS